jgi:dolichol-phosphate mannosyltransferase
MISIVVPVFNEQEALPELYRRVSDVMDSVDMPFEFVLVDDRSTDKSLEIMLELCQKDRNVKVLEFSRNFGHQMAIAAGLDYARGEAVITMDGDLQHPPEVIPEYTCLAFKQSVRKCSPRFRLRIGQAGLLVAYWAPL